MDINQVLVFIFYLYHVALFLSSQPPAALRLSMMHAGNDADDCVLTTGAIEGGGAVVEEPASKCPRKVYESGLCPLCGLVKELNNTANYRVVAVASRADPFTVPLFESQGVNSVEDSFRTCATCNGLTRSAFKCIGAKAKSSSDYLSCTMEKKTRRDLAKILHVTFTSQEAYLPGGNTLQKSEYAVAYLPGGNTPCVSQWGLNEAMDLMKANFLRSETPRYRQNSPLETS